MAQYICGATERIDKAELMPGATDKVQLVNERFPSVTEPFPSATDKVPLVDE